MTIFVTYCSKTKSDLQFGTAQDIYTSGRVKAFFKYAPRPRAILSAKHGIVFEDEVIENYDIAKPSQEAAEKLKDRVGNRHLTFWSPRPLTEKPWVELLDAAGVSYNVIRKIKE